MPFPRKTSLTILVFGVFMLLLGSRKLVRPVELSSVMEFRPRVPPAAPEPEPRRATTVARKQVGGSRGPAVAQLQDPDGALDHFYRALARSEAGQGITRVLHYGDSPVTADSITADLRSLLQERFGDAGHGFVLIAKPWAWYGHRGVEVRGSGWSISAATQERAHDGLHGLGGVSFEGSPGAWSAFRLESVHSRAEVSFLRSPAGGVFTLRAGDQTLGEIDTSGALGSDWASFVMPPDSREVRLEVQSGKVRVFGMSFEKTASGVIYNSLGLNGGQVQVVVRYFNPAHWSGQLQHQRPDLVVINYGTNESIYPKYLDTYYPGELRTVIERVKAAVPSASVLVMGPMDRGERDATGQIATSVTLPQVVRIQGEVAKKTGCAFFNTFEAMGGAGTMARWYASQPRLVTADFMHPFPAGARKIGILVDDALMAGYQRYRTAPALSAKRDGAVPRTAN